MYVQSNFKLSPNGMLTERKLYKPEISGLPVAVDDLDGKGVTTLPELNWHPSRNHPVSVSGKIMKSNVSRENVNSFLCLQGF